MRMLVTALAISLTLSTPAWAGDDWDDDWGEEDGPPPVQIHGFAEGAGSLRLVSDPAIAGDFPLMEARFRLDMAHYGDRASVSFLGDVVSDAVLGETVLDIRRTRLSLRATSWMDVQAGRQVLTWGTGDLVFLNDLFPKDFQSFFIGRDDEFLKAPSNTLKIGLYSSPVNLDLAWTPVFAPDLYITGERLSYYSPAAGGSVGGDSARVNAPLPESTLGNGELAARLYRNVGSFELAGYGYWGFFKQPVAYDPEAMTPVFSRLAVGGASLRGPAPGGLMNAEVAYYWSRDDSDGTDPTRPNSEARALVGYERELAPRVTLGVQYYVEWLQQYDALRDAAPDAEAPNRARHLATARLTWRLMQDTLTFSLFSLVGLDLGDSHWRPSVTRNLSDAVEVTLGANLMAGPRDSFFGQLRDNSNGYLRARYSF